MAKTGYSSRKESRMRKLIIGAVTAAALLGAPAAAGAATADSPWTPVPNGPITLKAGTFCAFQVDIAVIANKELQQSTTLPNGNTVVRVKGNLVLSFKNDQTGKTLDENVSGPSTSTYLPGANGAQIAFQGEGPNWLAFGPGGQANIHEPGLVFTKGLVNVTFATVNNLPTAQTFSLNGTQEDGCALLS
jgi:hypothetical protein